MPRSHIENFRYMLRSGMMGWFTLMLDTNASSAEQHSEAKKEIDLYKKELRPLIRDANLYHISPRPDGVHWDGIEYWDSDHQRGVVYAFRGNGEDEHMHSFKLQELQPSARYVLKFHDRSGSDRTISGKELMEQGLTLKLPITNSSELIFIAEEAP